MNFVNTYVSNIIFAFLQIKPDIPSDLAQGLTIFFIILFVSSIILASYILFRASRKRINNIERTIRETSTITEISENISTTSEEPSSFPVSVTPPPDNALSPSRLLLSIFKTVIVPVKSQSKVTPILAFPVSSSPVHSPSLPKPVPLRPKPVPIPIETPPAYSISNLQVEPSRAYPGDIIFVSFTITNNTAESNNQPISLKVNGFEIYSNSIFLNPYESKSLTYPIRAIEPGEWDMDVNNTLCKLVIVDDNL